jgi:DNA modification methylase
MIWRDRCTLHHGDFAETLVLCDGAADLVFTSPPYCDCRTYGMGCSWGMDDYHRLGVAVFDALRPGGHALINVDAPVREWRKGYGTERGFHPWRLMLDWAEEIGFRVPDTLIFGRQGMPGGYAGRLRNDWEPLLWFQRPGGDGFMDQRSIATKARYSRPVGAKTISGVTKDGERPNGKGYSGWCAENGMKLPGTAWNYGATGLGLSGAPDIERQNHPARWPYKLAEDIVRCFCPPDGLACDPFVGAGTSAAAALEHGRRFIGGDLGSRQDNEDNQRRGLDPIPWVDVTARVLDERFKQVRLFGPVAGSVPGWTGWRGDE